MYREVTMVEITEVLRLWRDGVPKKRIAARLGLDPKTVRRYISTAEGIDLPCDAGALTEAHVRDVLLALHPAGGRPRGDGWARCTPATLAPMAFTASSSSFWRRPMMKTQAPSSTNRCAVANPIPSVPPVMTAVLPSSFLVTLFLRHCRAGTLLRCFTLDHS